MPSAIAVFCGSSPGSAPHHMATAGALGRALAQRNIDLVYGGGRVGVMGAVADAVRAGGGNVTGVIPEFLMQREVGDTRSALEVTDSMHSRKRRMFDLADGFVSLAGGLGTLDETVEIITWKQLGLHNKPIVILSERGYWQSFETMVGEMIETGFAGKSADELYSVVENVDAVFDVFEDIEWDGIEASPSLL